MDLNQNNKRFKSKIQTKNHKTLMKSYFFDISR